MKKQRIWMAAGVAACVVWGAVAAVMWAAGSAKMTADKVVAMVDQTPLHTLSGDARADYLDRLAASVNRLSFEDRRDPAFEARLRQEFEAMSPAERQRYLEETFDVAIRQFVAAFNQMSRSERQSLVEKAQADLTKAQTEGLAAEERIDDASVEKMIEDGLKVYLSDASAEAKLDAQPLLEQMQRIQ
ncbi:MAG: hypothetical protein AAGA57_11430, partial [Planctomycetota bacterium]